MPLDQPTFPGERQIVLTGSGRILTSAFCTTPEAALDDDPATAAVWGEETNLTTPADILFLLDRSGSMEDAFGGGTRMEAAITALLASIDVVINEDSGSRIGVVSFGAGGISYGNLNAQVEAELTDDTSFLSAVVSSFVPVGSTPTMEGILTGRALLEDREDATAQTTLILLSDGAPDDVPGAKAAALSLKAAHPTWNLFVVGIDTEGDNAALQYIGETVGDGYSAADSPGALSSILTSLVVTLL